MTDTDAVTTRKTLRESMLRKVTLLRDSLELQGFEAYRVEELLNPKTNRHLRIGYANDVWTFHVSDHGPRDGVATDGMTSVRTFLVDLRVYGQDRVLPAVDELLAQILK